MATAIEKLKQMTAWDSAPELTLGELEGLLADASLSDKDGLVPLDIAWTPTYNLNAAAAAGWLIKAARSSMLTEIDPPGSGIVTSRVFDNCRAMARIYAAKNTASVSVEKTYA